MATDNLTENEQAALHRVEKLAKQFGYEVYDHSHLNPPHWTLYGRNSGEQLLQEDDLATIEEWLRETAPETQLNEATESLRGIAQICELLNERDRNEDGYAIALMRDQAHAAIRRIESVEAKAVPNISETESEKLVIARKLKEFETLNEALSTDEIIARLGRHQWTVELTRKGNYRAWNSAGWTESGLGHLAAILELYNFCCEAHDRLED